jgi:phosphonate transport system substrate-binding protein
MARLIEAGFDAGRVLADARFLGDHLEVLRAVINGQVDAGASFYGALKAGRVRGIDVSGLRVLAVTGRIPFDAVVARPGLDPAVAASVTAVLDRLNGSSPEARAALSGLLDVDGFVPSDDSFYDPVRAMLKAVRAAGVEAP